MQSHIGFFLVYQVPLHIVIAYSAHLGLLNLLSVLHLVTFCCMLGTCHSYNKKKNEESTGGEGTV